MIPLFNKKNALIFANKLYSENKDEINYIKLCNGYITEPPCHPNACKDQKLFKRKKYLHCVVGEAYFHFVSHKMGWVDDADENNYLGKYTGVGSTGKAIESLVEKAILKNSTDNNRKAFAKALFRCVSANDTAMSDHDVELSEEQEKKLSYKEQMEYLQREDEKHIYINRAKSVAKVWRESVVPLLK